MGFHTKLDKMTRDIEFPITTDSFKLLIADIHLLYDESWNKKSKNTPKISNVTEPKQVSILQSDIRSNMPIRMYRSISDASKTTNVCEKKILRTCSGKQSSAGGYRWSFFEDKE